MTNANWKILIAWRDPSDQTWQTAGERSGLSGKFSGALNKFSCRKGASIGVVLPFNCESERNGICETDEWTRRSHAGHFAHARPIQDDDR